MIGRRERRDGAEAPGVELAFGRLRSLDVSRREEAVGDAGQEVGGAVCGAVVAVARALFFVCFFGGGGGTKTG